MSGADIPVRVALRSRPLGLKELQEGCQSCLEFITDEPQVIINGNKAFTYDYAFSADTGQLDVYRKCIYPLIGNILKGYNVTILAYGQTGSGKTFTMGTVFSGSCHSDQNLGIIPRAVDDLFAQMKNYQNHKYLIKASFLEIYKEEIIDLLNTSNKEELAIREDPSGAVKIVGLSELPVDSCHDALDYLKHGSSLRTTGATAMNLTSSRSHAIFTLTIECKSASQRGNFSAKLHFVDLAGSERAKKTGAQGDRFKEGVNINLGLLALGNVISALCTGDSRNHIPYRESKLTRLLQDSLGGNSHTVMIACVSPADCNLEETLNTMRYADRARKIKNKPIVNRNPESEEVTRLRLLVKELQAKIVNGTPSSAPKEDNSPHPDMEILLSKNKQLTEENEYLAKELQLVLDNTTNLYEKAILAEMARDKMKAKLEELRIKMSCMSDSLNQTCKVTGDPGMMEIVDVFKGICDNVDELQTAQTKEELDASDSEDQKGECDENENCEFHSQSTFRQAAISHKLQELNKLLAIKEELAGQLTQRDDRFTTMKEHYEINIHQLEDEISALQKEKEEFCKHLQTVQLNPASNKISEQRRKRLQELEMQINEYKKKIQEFEKIAKMKENTDAEVKKLKQEISEMKRTRVRLIRQMKTEGERLRQWKLEKEKEVGQLKQQERRRQVEIARKQQQFDKQQNVLRRKMEDAVTANKRLKEALLKQKLNGEKRVKDRGQKSDNQRLHAWLEQEIELVVSAKEASYHLERLLDDRKLISEELHKWKMMKARADSTSESSDSSSEEHVHNINRKISELQKTLDIQNIQISDLQQKIIDASSDANVHSRWNALQSMMDAKLALSYLFEMNVSDKTNLAMKSEAYKNLEQTCAEIRDAFQDLNNQISRMDADHQQEVLKLEQEHDAKVLSLLQLPKEKPTSPKPLKFNEPQNLKPKVLLNAINVAIDSNLHHPDPQPVKKSARKYEQFKEEFSSDENCDNDDENNDPDWHDTPLMRRIQKMKSNPIGVNQQFDFTADDSDFQSPKLSLTKASRKRRSGDHCACKSGCKTKLCSCLKSARKCGQSCKCNSCTNVENSMAMTSSQEGLNFSMI